MNRCTAFDSNCPIARITELLGEHWTLLIVREAFLGTRRFNDFERELGIARNILSSRLKKLVEAGVLDRVVSAQDRRVIEYRLTEAGADLLPVLIGLAQWASRWLCKHQHPMRFVERATGQDLSPVSVCSQDGRSLAAREIALLPGPDADPMLRERYQRAGVVASNHSERGNRSE